MAKKMVYTSPYVGDVEVKLFVSEYLSTDSVYIGLIGFDEDGCPEPFGDLTVALDFLLPNYAFVDVNNLSNAEKFIEKYKLGKPTGTYRNSGFCSYPLYEFDMEMVGQYLYEDKEADV